MISYPPSEGCIRSTLIVRKLWHQICSRAYSASFLKPVLTYDFVWIPIGDMVLFWGSLPRHLQVSIPLNPSCKAWKCPFLHYFPLDTPGFSRPLLIEGLLEFVKDWFDWTKLRDTCRGYDGVVRVDPICSQESQPSGAKKSSSSFCHNLYVTLGMSCVLGHTCTTIEIY